VDGGGVDNATGAVLVSQNYNDGTTLQGGLGREGGPRQGASLALWRRFQGFTYLERHTSLRAAAWAGGILGHPAQGKRMRGGEREEDFAEHVIMGGVEREAQCLLRMHNNSQKM
jgi:hypothetical protein